MLPGLERNKLAIQNDCSASVGVLEEASRIYLFGSLQAGLQQQRSSTEQACSSNS